MCWNKRRMAWRKPSSKPVPAWFWTSTMRATGGGGRNVGDEKGPRRERESNRRDSLFFVFCLVLVWATKGSAHARGESARQEELPLSEPRPSRSTLTRHPAEDDEVDAHELQQVDREDLEDAGDELADLGGATLEGDIRKKRREEGEGEGVRVEGAQKGRPGEPKSERAPPPMAWMPKCMRTCSTPLAKWRR